MTYRVVPIGKIPAEMPHSAAMRWAVCAIWQIVGFFTVSPPRLDAVLIEHTLGSPSQF